jgi:hypothetical protein
VLHNGQVVEAGTHDELLATHGRYAAMWDVFDVAAKAGPVTRPAESLRRPAPRPHR